MMLDPRHRQTKIILGIAAATLILGGAILAVDPPAPMDEHGHSHGDEHDHGGAALPNHVDITPETARASGVVTEVAGPRAISDVVEVMGSVVLDPSGHARVNARFTGIIREVKKNIGDRVSMGEALALVESNESLQAYQVKSPIDGVVIGRNKNVGEITGSEPLFEVANLGKVYAELHVFPRDLGKVKSGQKIILATPDGTSAGEGVLGALLPVAEASSQSVLARVALDNGKGLWRPGMAVRGRIVTAENAAALAVKAGAVQDINGQAVVFVAGKKEFEVRPVLLGKSDEEWVEVLEGVYEGEVYAAVNSFLFKAELGKASAEHEH
jgi:cobalt-zinc-cadmium efflux system membrane fusion protein